MSSVICEVCEDTHTMLLSEEYHSVMCTHCPLPCDDCASDAYCRETPCFCLCHKDLPWYDGNLSWYSGPLTKEHLADVRHKLAKVRGLLMSFLDPECHPSPEQIELMIKETDDF